MLVTYCNACGKKFSSEDEYEGGKISSNVDDIIIIDLCRECYQKLLASLSPQCVIQPYENSDNEDEYNYQDDNNGDYDFDGELN